MSSFLNESFAENMTGTTIKFDVQPYAHGTMVITKIVERKIAEHKIYHPEHGGMFVTYNVFDIEGECISGSETGALICGVPVKGTTHNLADKTYRIVGVSRGKLYRAVFEGATIVQASCG